jgi:hypothetical protein
LLEPGMPREEDKAAVDEEPGAAPLPAGFVPVDDTGAATFPHAVGGRPATKGAADGPEARGALRGTGKPRPGATRAAPPGGRHAARTTVTDSVYHQKAGDHQPTHEPLTFYVLHETAVKPYSREVTLTEEWVPVDLGWVAETGQPPSMILVVNLEGKYAAARLPSDAERAAVAAAMVEIGVAPAASNEKNRTHFSPKAAPTEATWKVSPGRHARVEPAVDVSRLRLRCREGQAVVKLIVFPA